MMILRAAVVRGVGGGARRAALRTVPRQCRVLSTQPRDAEGANILGVALSELMELRKQRSHINSQIHDLEGLLEQGQKEFGVSIEEIAQIMDDDDAEDLGLDENLIMEILPVGHSILNQVAKPVPDSMFNSPELDELVNKMVYTMTMFDGVGLAAPQVGESLRLLVLEQDHVDPTPRPDRKLPDEYAKDMREEDYPTVLPRQVLINPTVTPTDDSRETVFFESCLSIAGHHALVPRHSSVYVEAYDQKGNLLKFTAEGWHARVIQHEVDHLDGVLFPDRMLPKTFANDEAYYVENFREIDDGDFAELS